jgi:hypothetical protein
MKVVRHRLCFLAALLFTGLLCTDTATTNIDPVELGPERQLEWNYNFPEQISGT